MKKCTKCKKLKQFSEFGNDVHKKDGLTCRCRVCKLAPTGYKPGRPRKGEIRPETPQGKRNAIWREKNYERAKEINRNSTTKFKLNHPERVKEIDKGVILRKKGWAGTKLSVATDAVIINRKNQAQEIIVQVDAT